MKKIPVKVEALYKGARIISGDPENTILNIPSKGEAFY